jgi:hypothetical protein
VSARRWRAPVQVAALAVVLVALVYCAWFRLSGGHWERVESPSMGTTAPVGTLLWVRPVAAHDLRVGDIVTFHEPGRATGRVFSHRVRDVLPDGSFLTRGDLSGDDQWTVAPTDLVGRAQWVWPGVGRLVQAAPVLLLGAVLTVGLVALLRRRGKLPAAILGGSLTLAAAIVVYQPLIGAEQLFAAPTADGGYEATYVATGLLPVRVSAPGESHVVLHPGEAGTVTATHVDSGRLTLDIKPDIPWEFWLILLAGTFVPALVSAAVGTVERSPGRRVALAH